MISKFKNRWVSSAVAALGLSTVLSTFSNIGFAQLNPAKTAEPRAVAPRGPLQEQERSLVTLFEQTAPSVAYITTERVQTNFFMEQSVARGAGSGFVWDREGHIVTNFHVLQGAQRVQVQLDAGKLIVADVVGIAPEYDLAVVKLKTVARDLRPIPLGTSNDLKIGQSVIAIGNPFGLKRTLTAGIVSSLDRQIPSIADNREISGVIQTDAAINPGNSGGPLLDSAGRLIGVNSQIVSGSGTSAGVGFSIPVDTVNRIVPQLIARGRAAQPGIGINPVNQSVVARYGIAGVVIESVRNGTPAAEAGLAGLDRRSNEIGDTIIATNGKPVETLANLISELDRIGIGNSAELTVRRGDPSTGKERKVKIKIIDTSVR